MSRLTVNEAGTSGYTDEIILTPGDFTAAAGNSTTQVNAPVKEGDVIYGVAVEVTEAFSVDTDLTVGIDADVDGTAADPDALITAQAVESLGVSVNTGADIVAGAGPLVADDDGNIEIIAGAALDGATSGKLRVLLGIRRINA
tara:strand:- start:18 stop:446 length:429 start_codon:yes stop_codon:yes gene_type:complete